MSQAQITNHVSPEVRAIERAAWEQRKRELERQYRYKAVPEPGTTQEQRSAAARARHAARVEEKKQAMLARANILVSAVNFAEVLATKSARHARKNAKSKANQAKRALENQQATAKNKGIRGATPASGLGRGGKKK
jgi:hypothetical protein